MARLGGEKTKKKAAAEPSDAIDVTLNVAATVLKTLETVASVSPIPGLAQAAGLALEITNMVQMVKGNKSGFIGLADDSRQLVYVIFCANRNVEKVEDVPAGLPDQLDQVLKVLLEVKTFAEKGSSRGRFKAFMRSGVDLAQIKDHQQKLQQCLSKFGFQADISLQVMVHKLVAQNGKVLEMLENKDLKAEPKGEPTGSTPDPTPNPNPNPSPDPNPGGSPPSAFFGGAAGGTWGSGIKINHTAGDVSLNHVSNVTNNTDSGNTYTNTTINKDNHSTISNSFNRAGDTVTNDHSVKMGDGVTFAGASGINFGSNNTNNISHAS